jgi:uncharacterized protein YdhG (YjbR/CyaY superfamily)
MNEIDLYISQFPPQIGDILQKIRNLTQEIAPFAVEKISYKIPSFHYHGQLIYYAAFKNHFSIFPPIHGDQELLNEIAPFANEKGNLLFQYKNPIPWDLITKVIRRRLYENQEKYNQSKKMK